MGALANQIVAAVDDLHSIRLNPHLGGPESRFAELVEATLFANRDVEIRDGNIGPDDGAPHPTIEVMWACAPSVRLKQWGLATDLLRPNTLAHFRPDELVSRRLGPGRYAAPRRVLLPERCDMCAEPLSVAHSRTAEAVAVVPVACGATVVLITVCAACEPVHLRPYDRVLRAELR